MKFLLRRCQSCGNYTMKYECPKCNSATFSPHPARYSPDDKYARYRIKDAHLNSS
ncbi:MAG TPA: RNA-protein complex protein Nop10 [Nitrososphaeraceae archaeon]